MGRIGLFSTVIVAIALGSGACRRGDDRANAATEGRDAGGREEVTITGCLTGAPDRNAFVVTPARDALASGALHSGTGEVPTFTYELVGNSGDLSPHVGRQVEVTGKVDDERDDEVDVDRKDKTESPRVDDKVTPAIETKEEVEIKVRRLEVSSVRPTGQPCK